ncbi:isopentenyl-diphosphate Delta-isomerase [Goodfellowiella coeruleoviolacea]|uniref:Isopentenyl-diphosphate Delta-isomerase n=1 Tax=Goodfellowiella coeruleoviolacea TaxID=334858 RepID=A0AAE3KHD6_9PSEU|nr:isopentenyl-diphosphate Delta-isomerase [Goodfellowiella coeruleoviolacea]MCP2166762.1 isopentenyl-diphosphate delta-isomerase [Goodfellowiella coeruleoviolacea]
MAGELVEANGEQVVLCGPRHERIGTAPKAEVHTGATPLHLAFSCYVFDQDGQLLVTHRAASKTTWPGVRTNSCCGHPAPDEPMVAAVARRLRHELGLTTDRIELILPDFTYRATMANGVVEHEVCPVYRAVVATGTVAHPNPTEVDRAYWYPWRRFVAEAAADPGQISPWSGWQVAELAELGDDPLAWPVAGDERLPPAAKVA